MKIRTGFVSNSSSSSFICDTSMSLAEVDKKLRIMYNFAKEFDFFGYESLDFEDMFNEPFIATKKYEREMQKDWGSAPLEIEGKIIINGNSDNSIPYTLFEVIQDVFKATRIHMG